MSEYYDLPLLFDSDRTLHELKAIFDTLDHLDAWINYTSLEVDQDYTYFEIQYPKRQEKQLIGWIEEMKDQGLKIDYDTISEWGTEVEE